MRQLKQEGFMRIDERVAILETIAFSVNATMLEMKRDAEKNRLEIKQDIKELALHVDKKIDGLDNKIDRLETKMDTKIESINNRLWFVFLWLLGAIISSSVGLAAFTAHAVHWL